MRERVVDVGSLDLPRGSWALCSLKAIGERSELAPLPRRDLVIFLRTFEIALRSPDSRQILRSPIQLVGKSEVRQLFTHVEAQIELVDSWGPAVQARASMLFRRWVVEYAGPHRFGEDLARITLVFKTRLTGRHPPRAILSDYIGDHQRDANEPPIDALPNENPADLRTKVASRINADAERLATACISELKFWTSVRRRLDELAALPGPPYLEKAAERFFFYIKKNPGSDLPQLLGADFIAACARLADTPARSRHIAFGRVPQSISDDITRVLSIDRQRLDAIPGRQILGMRFRAHSLELVAAFYLLLLNTSWNSHTLLDLRSEDIDFDSSFIRLHAYKSKTGQQTQKVILDIHQPGVKLAAELFLFNNSQLKKHGFIRQDDGRGWIGWQRSRSTDGPLLMNFHRIHQHFLKIHQLPHFSKDQIRTHVLVQTALNRGTIEAVRQAGDHASISTTGHYLDQFITKILSSATNLEFQKRFERQIIRTANSRLKPVGDGTLCSDPTSPPEPSWLVGGQCGGADCHANLGCSNNRIAITLERIEEVVRLNNYYKRHWTLLANRNPDLMRTHHIPAFLFNSALLEFLRRGTHRDLVLNVERTLSGEVANG
ncbi:hypothetical protein [Niveibacterium sp. SC-1]|uniref:hypothetical protein n=1 Tax=Niveibacterium sp. SC-1 TaxID=3135646 RepID=UPI00311E40D2